MKAKQINKIIDVCTVGAAAYFVGALIAGAIKRKKEESGIGALKRRIYKEVSLAQDAGVDFQKKFADLSGSERDALIRLGQDMGWKQSKRAAESGKPYAESYYNSLRRAWNAVSGVQGIGRAYNIKDSQGNVVLTWIENAQAHVDAEQRVLEAEKRAAESRKRLRKTRATIPTVAPAPTPKAPKVNKKEAEYEERYNFAQMVWDKFMEKNKGFSFDNDKINENNTKVAHFGFLHNVIADAFARKAIKLKKIKGYGYELYLQLANDPEWYNVGVGWVVEYAEMLLTEEKIARNAKGWEDSADALNQIRKDLLERAKHMQVVVYDDGRERIITGDDRYNYLDGINYVVMITNRYGEEKTVYPIRSYDDEEFAKLFVNQWRAKKRKDSGFSQSISIIPVYDVNIKSITGISGMGYTPEVERELFEIWREELEYGYTELDYNTWRAIYGDEFAKVEVLPHMR